MGDRFLDGLPDLGLDQYSRQRGILKHRSTPAKPHFPKPRFVDYPAVRQKLVDALIDLKIRRKWQAAITRVFQETKKYDKRWRDDPNNPFPIEWFKNNLPHAIEQRGQFNFNKLSEQEYVLWRRIVKELTGFNVTQGSKKVLKIFEKKRAKYLEGHRTFYIWEAEELSRLANDEDLLCCVLGIYHDWVCEFAPKVVTDEIRNLDLDMYRSLANFAGWLDQAKLETLLAYAEDKGLLKSGRKGRKGSSTRRQSKSRKKTPPQLLKETRERQAALELAENPNITAEKLGKILVCNKSTVTRLKAWQNRDVLDYDKPPNGFKRDRDKDGPDIEVIDKSQ